MAEVRRLAVQEFWKYPFLGSFHVGFLSLGLQLPVCLCVASPGSLPLSSCHLPVLACLFTYCLKHHDGRKLCPSVSPALSLMPTLRGFSVGHCCVTAGE